jgi:hypothetical protein
LGDGIARLFEGCDRCVQLLARILFGTSSAGGINGPLRLVHLLVGGFGARRKQQRCCNDDLNTGQHQDG